MSNSDIDWKIEHFDHFVFWLHPFSPLISCNLLTADMADVFPIDQAISEEVRNDLLYAQEQLCKNKTGKFGLVITGASLEHALTDHKVRNFLRSS